MANDSKNKPNESYMWLMWISVMAGINIAIVASGMHPLSIINAIGALMCFVGIHWYAQELIKR